MKNKSWIRYLVYILLVFGLIYLDGYVGKQQAIYLKETFNVSIVYFIISMIIKIGIGSVLGLEYIINEMSKEGTWKVNLPKIILIVVPTLYFSISFPLLYLYDNLIYMVLTYPMFIFMRNDSVYIYISQLMLGYFLITNFFKQSKDIKNETII